MKFNKLSFKGLICGMLIVMLMQASLVLPSVQAKEGEAQLTKIINDFDIGDGITVVKTCYVKLLK